MQARITVATLLFATLAMSGCLTTQEGVQQAYITSVGEEGWVWKTGEVHVKYKPDTTYDEEGVHTYCIDKKAPGYADLMEKARGYAGTQERVLLHYHKEAVVAPWRCGPNLIIDDISLAP